MKAAASQPRGPAPKPHPPKPPDPAAAIRPRPSPRSPRAYAEAVHPNPYRILGLNLQPFALGHYLTMRRFECAFVQQQEGQATLNDLLLGALICSLPADGKQFMEFIQQKDFDRQMKRWGQKIGMPDFQEKARLFMEYLRAGWEEPAHFNKQPGSSGGDWVQNIRITLMTRLGYSNSEVMTMPMSQALADYFKLAEADGIIHLISAEEIASMAANSAALAALQKLQTKTEAPCPG